MDRASGSGVFARDADALLDMVKLDVPQKAEDGNRIALRVEGTLREFPSFQPFDVWFQYPLHRRDTEGVLADAKPRSEKSPQQRGTEAAADKRARERENRNIELWKAYNEISQRDGVVTTGTMAKKFSETPQNMRNWIDVCPYLERDEKGKIWLVERDAELPSEWKTGWSKS